MKMVISFKEIYNIVTIYKKCYIIFLFGRNYMPIFITCRGNSVVIHDGEDFRGIG